MTWRKRFVIGTSAVALLTLTGTALWFFAPFQFETSLCRICDRQKSRLSILGVTCAAKEFDSELSAWYRASGLRSHEHEWAFLCSTERQWGGNVICSDGFGFEVQALDRFREVSPKMDQNTFEALAREYEAIGQDRKKTWAFFEKLDKISPPRREDSE